MAPRLLQEWDRRPPEIATLLNPAFCALLIRASAKGFALEARSGIPLPLAYLVLPLILHRPTRLALPSTLRTGFLPWIEANSFIRAGFPERMESLAPYTREAILFAVQHRSLSLSDNAELAVVPRGTRSVSEITNSETGECLMQSELMGKRFARAGETATMYAALGIRL